MRPWLVPPALAVLRHYPVQAGKWRLARALDTHFKGAPARQRVRMVGGASMLLDTTDFLQRILFLMRDFEPPIGACIRSRLREGDCFVDIGANIGFYSLMAARSVGRTGRVIAFEPNASTYASLQANIALNDYSNITAERLALAERCGEAAFYPDVSGNSGASSLLRPEGAAGAVTVPLSTWDAYAAAHRLPPPALVKIDVEGMEMRVLDGMGQLLSGPARPCLLVEVSDLGLRGAGSSRDALLGRMASYGYRERTLSPLRETNDPQHGPAVQYDALFEPLS